MSESYNPYQPPESVTSIPLKAGFFQYSLVFLQAGTILYLIFFLLFNREFSPLYRDTADFFNQVLFGKRLREWLGFLGMFSVWVWPVWICAFLTILKRKKIYLILASLIPVAGHLLFFYIVRFVLKTKRTALMRSAVFIRFLSLIAFCILVLSEFYPSRFVEKADKYLALGWLLSDLLTGVIISHYLLFLRKTGRLTEFLQSERHFVPRL